MGSRFADYQDAQRQAIEYAASQRKLSRNTFRYLMLTALTTTLTLIIAPELVITSLIVSAVGYGLYRFGPSAYTKAKHAYLNWQAKRTMTAEDLIDGSPLLERGHSRANLRELAQGGINDALIHKSSRCSHYSTEANFSDKEPLSYADRKHQRALFQYRMLEYTKEAALRADEGFIGDFAHDKQHRRARKADMVKTLLNDYLNPEKLTLKVTHLEESGKYEVIINEKTEGAKIALINALHEWNNENGQHFIEIPAGNTRKEDEKFLRTALLPLLLDMNSLSATVKPTHSAPEKKAGRKIFKLLTWDISNIYVAERLAHLEKPKNDAFAQFGAASIR